MAPEAMRGEGAPLANDLLSGGDAIAEYVYGTAIDDKTAEANRRRVCHLIEKHNFPAFKLGGVVSARKSKILSWIEAQETAA